MISILLVTFVIVYTHNVWPHLSAFLQVKYILEKIRTFLVAYDSKPNNYDDELRSLLKYADVMAKYISSPELHCRELESVTYSNCKWLFDDFWMLKNKKWHSFINSLNPLPSIRGTILFPITVLSWLGFNPGKIASLCISMAGWIIPRLTDMFSEEIKTFLISLIK